MRVNSFPLPLLVTSCAHSQRDEPQLACEEEKPRIQGAWEGALDLESGNLGLDPAQLCRSCVTFSVS